MIITRQDRQITKNFKESEFFSKSPNVIDNPGRFDYVDNRFYFKANGWSTKLPENAHVIIEDHELSDVTIEGLQIIRSWAKEPIWVTSTYRPMWYNNLSTVKGGVGSNKHSQHPKCTAIDFSFHRNGKLLELINEFQKKGYLWSRLRGLGISGFGIYNTFIHIHSRTGGKKKDKYGNYAYWDNR